MPFDRWSIIILAVAVVAAIVVRNAILRIGQESARRARPRNSSSIRKKPS